LITGCIYLLIGGFLTIVDDLANNTPGENEPKFPDFIITQFAGTKDFLFLKGETFINPQKTNCKINKPASARAPGQKV